MTAKHSDRTNPPGNNNACNGLDVHAGLSHSGSEHTGSGQRGPDVDSGPDIRSEDKFLKTVGLALRARQAVIGQDEVFKSIQGRKARLVIVATDAGANGAKKYRDKCAFYQVPFVVVSDRERLGNACGRPYTVVVSVVDEGFAKMLTSLAWEIYGGEAFGETSSL